jgi:tetratricopeptide (TPR) repeat protein
MNHMFKIAVSVAGLGLAVLGLAAAQERFDMRVRNDFFAGFAGNHEALDRGMKLCEEELARNPANAAALVWHGAGVFFESKTYFQAGDRAKGIEFWQRGLGEMDKAVTMAPDDLGVRIPRGAVLLTASRVLPDAERARPLIEKGVGDFEHTLEIQKTYFDALGTHPRGELLIGLADGYARLGKDDQATAYFERIRAALPGSAYAASADKWLASKTLAPREAGCLGCHVAK